MPWLTDSAGIAYVTKDPSEDIDFVIDFTPWCVEKQDTIVSTLWTIVDSSNTPVNKDHDTFTAAGLVAIWLQGGLLNTIATIKVVFTTAAGRKKSKTFNVRVLVS